MIIKDATKTLTCLPKLMPLQGGQGHKGSLRNGSDSWFLASLIMALLIACNPKQPGKETSANKIKGDWAFLDGRGNYNEAFFSDSSFRTFNMVFGAAPEFKYFIRNDSLYTNNDKRKQGLNRIAKVEWLTQDKVIFTTEFSRDTLDRLRDETITLENTDPVKDSSVFKINITRRYEKFLMTKGIISLEEMEAFRKEGSVPKDVLEKRR